MFIHRTLRVRLVELHFLKHEIIPSFERPFDIYWLKILVQSITALLDTLLNEILFMQI